MTKQQIKRRLKFLQSIIDKFIKSGRKATRGLKKWLLSIIEKIDRLQSMLDSVMDVVSTASVHTHNLQSVYVNNAQSNEQLSLFELSNFTK